MYTFTNTEQNQNKCNEYETKSMLFLFNFHEDKDNIDLVAVDCFNDVTGLSDGLDILWDVQSKGVKSLRPKTIGEALATLYKNFLSDIQFKEYLLFTPTLKEQYYNNPSLDVYDVNNFVAGKIPKIKEGVWNEHCRRNSLGNTVIDDISLSEFLKHVVFVSSKYGKDYYTRNIIKFKNGELKSKDFFNDLFNEIRDMQSAKKNILIEGVQLKEMSELVNYNKTINKSDLEILTINRIVGADIFSQKGIPFSFYPHIQGLDADEVKDIILDCNYRLSLFYFDKHRKTVFWRLFELIFETLDNNIEQSSKDVFDSLPNKLLESFDVLNEISYLYLISLVKDGLENDN